ncbi:MAG: hypothetical protein PHR28_01270 [candidate division Zixibacteria bacterium]|nr:hypothetical protein [candidate division Zixibacteria bacterium]
MKKTTILITLSAILLASTATGFDGHRKGFVLGGGLGFAPVARWSVEESFLGHTVYGYHETKAGVGVNVLIGYAWDEKNMIVYEGNAAGYNSDILKETITQGFDGGAWYHYFGQPGKTAFTTVGFGFYGFLPEETDHHDPGYGMLLGGGYEFARHLQVGAYLSFGVTSADDIDYHHTSLSVLVSGVAF